MTIRRCVASAGILIFLRWPEPGLYVIDFIGNGKNSRVLLQKGKLQYVVRTTPAGLAFTVFDEQNRPLADASSVDGWPDLSGQRGRARSSFPTARSQVANRWF